jgi:hypothetical protein
MDRRWVLSVVWTMLGAARKIDDLAVWGVQVHSLATAWKVTTRFCYHCCATQQAGPSCYLLWKVDAVCVVGVMLNAASESMKMPVISLLISLLFGAGTLSCIGVQETTVNPSSLA